MPASQTITTSPKTVAVSAGYVVMQLRREQHGSPALTAGGWLAPLPDSPTNPTVSPFPGANEKRPTASIQPLVVAQQAGSYREVDRQVTFPRPVPNSHPNASTPLRSQLTTSFGRPGRTPRSVRG